MKRSHAGRWGLAIVFCAALAGPAPVTWAQSTTQPAVKDRYSRSPGTRVKTGVSQALAAQQRMLSLEGPNITETEQPSLGDTEKQAAAEAFVKFLNDLVAAIQALFAASSL